MKKGYWVVQQTRNLIEITLLDGTIIKKQLTQSQIRGIIRTEKVRGIRKVVC